jgi:Mg2+/Co2+ transporter CorB
METIPSPGQRLRIGDYSLEVLQVTDNAVKTVRLKPVADPQLSRAGG